MTTPHVPSLAHRIAGSLGLEIIAAPGSFELTGAVLTAAGIRWTFSAPSQLLSRLLLLEAAHAIDPSTFAF